MDNPAANAVASYDCCGVRISVVTMAGAASAIAAAGARGDSLCVHLCNAFTLALAARDDRYKRLLNDAAMNLPDGTPVAWFGATLNREHRRLRAIPGPSLMTSVFELTEGTNAKHFLLGATEDVLADLKDRLEHRFPGADIVGLFAPPHTSDVRLLSEVSVAEVESTSANIVWIGLGTPKQDWIAQELAERARLVAIPVGAAFDFISGRKPEAPKWLRGSGFEWLFRLLTEPRRLWRRYLLEGPIFVGTAARSWIRQKAHLGTSDGR